jgi:hypothetical protein
MCCSFSLFLVSKFCAACVNQFLIFELVTFHICFEELFYMLIFVSKLCAACVDRFFPCYCILSQNFSVLLY